MKSNILNILLAFFILSTIHCCTNTDSDEQDEPETHEINYRQEMRNFVQNISSYAKNHKADFFILPQNGVELVTISGDYLDDPAVDYLSEIDGIGQEDLFFGYNNDDEPTPLEESTYLMHYLDIAKDNGVKILVTDYCDTHLNMDESYVKSEIKSYVSFAADHRELDNIPDYPVYPFNMNNETITNLTEVKNFLYLINPSGYGSKQEFIDSIASTNYDLLIMDCFFNNEEYSTSEILQLKEKLNGGKRLVISYMSIGEAEDYRYYWNESWNTDPPEWIAGENTDWEGNYKVKYWESEWQNIIFGSDNSYLNKILDSGFDGVYLDIIDAFEYFED